MRWREWFGIGLERVALWIAVLVVIGNGSVPAATRTWNAATTGYWGNTACWFEGVVPTDGDDVFITNAAASAILDGSSSNLNSLTITKTLTFTNWTTRLTAGTVTIQSNGLITLPPAFTTNQMSNRVYIVCTNLILDAGGQINVDSKGYAGGPVGPVNGYGPGRGLGGAGVGSGAGHGGRGGVASAIWQTTVGVTYGSIDAPTAPGSGGGGNNNTAGGHGGGAVRIDAAGSVTINGSLRANGGEGGGLNASGSGGSIYITCFSFGGDTGVIQAKEGIGSGGADVLR